VICFEGECDIKDLENADKCGLKVFTFGEVIEQGKAHKEY